MKKRGKEFKGSRKKFIAPVGRAKCWIVIHYKGWKPEEQRTLQVKIVHLTLCTQNHRETKSLMIFSRCTPCPISDLPARKSRAEENTASLFNPLESLRVFHVVGLRTIHLA